MRQLSLNATPAESAARKAAGAYRTRRDAADIAAAIAIDRPGLRVLEPCFGTGTFLAACLDRMAAVGVGSILGIEHNPEAVRLARPAFPSATLLEGDFLAGPATPDADVVIGNPPAIRFQAFTGPERQHASTCAEAAGLNLPGSANAWAAFVAQAVRHLRPAGMLCLLVPGEIRTARYAADVLPFLCRSFETVRLIDTDAPLVDGVQERMVILCAWGRGGSASGYGIVRADSLSEIDPASVRTARVTEMALDGDASAVLDPATTRLYGALRDKAVRLGDVASVGIGYLTGANDFFHLTREEVTRRGLGADVQLALRSAHDLRGVGLTLSSWDEASLATEGAHWLFCPRGSLSAAAAAYVREGEGKGVQAAYKCAVRSPWWRVPGARAHDFVVPVFSGVGPRIVATSLPATNTLLAGDLTGSVGAGALAVASLSSFAALSAELTGHALGGGALVLVPEEARAWRLLLPEDAAPPDMEAVSEALREGDRERATSLVDRIILEGLFELAPPQVEALRAAARHLRQRRLRRRPTAAPDSRQATLRLDPATTDTALQEPA